MDAQVNFREGRVRSAYDSYSGPIPEVQPEYSCATRLSKLLMYPSPIPSPNSKKCFFRDSALVENAKTKQYARISSIVPRTIWSEYVKSADFQF